MNLLRTAVAALLTVAGIGLAGAADRPKHAAEVLPSIMTVCADAS